MIKYEFTNIQKEPTAASSFMMYFGHVFMILIMGDIMDQMPNNYAKFIGIQKTKFPKDKVIASNTA